MKLSDEILDAIDGYEETSGRDSRYSEWAANAKALEEALRRANAALVLVMDARAPLGDDVSLAVSQAERQSRGILAGGVR